METKDVILSLRNKNNLSQEELAETVFVTRQAVSRWETGETIPNTETLKQLSKLFDVSINTLLGTPRQLICQCCGMPLDDETLSKQPDGEFNEDYCKWCYSDGRFTYESMEELIREGVDTFIEIGPGKTLSGFLKKIDRNAVVYSIQTMEHLEKPVALLKGRNL